MLAEWPHIAPRGVGRGRRPSGGADGQQRGRPPQPRRRLPRPPGPAAHQRRDRRRLVLRQPGAERRLRPSSCRGFAPPPDGARRPRRRPRGRRARRGHGRARRAPRAAHPTASSSTPSPMAATRPPRSADDFLPELEARFDGRATVASVTGRYWAMDRDRRWDRTKRAYDAIVHGIGLNAPTAAAAVADAYARDEGDEFIQPTLVGEVVPMTPDDAAVHLNFRADRGRQLTHALAQPSFDRFDRGGRRRLRRDDADRVPGSGRAAGGGRLPAARHRLAGGAPVTAREAAAPRRRDREVRPCHLFLQRRRRGAVPRRGPHPHSLEPRGADLRPRPGDERRPDHRRADRGSRPPRARLHRRQLRERRHGWPHRRLVGRGRSRQRPRRRARPPRTSRARRGRLARHHRRPRQHRGDARRVRRPADEAHDLAGAVRPRLGGARRRAPSRRRAGRRRPDPVRAPRPPARARR